MRKTKYQKFVILHFRPGNKTCFKIYRHDKFLATSSKLKDAKRRIDFCLQYGIWK